MSDVTLKMKLSPKSAGALFSKACRLEDENEQLRARVAELEAEEEGAKEAFAAVVEKRQILEAKVSKMERSLEVMRYELAKRPTTGGAW